MLTFLLIITLMFLLIPVLLGVGLYCVERCRKVAQAPVGDSMKQSGNLSVTGKNSIRIPLKGFVREVCVRFEREHEHVPCNPHHKDRLEWQIECVDEDKKHHHDPGHIHHDREFFLIIMWEVSGMREIEWFVID